jgi:hypothetical protein
VFGSEAGFQDNEVVREVKGSSRVDVVKSKNAAVMILGDDGSVEERGRKNDRLNTSSTQGRVREGAPRRGWWVDFANEVCGERARRWAART